MSPDPRYRSHGLLEPLPTNTFITLELVGHLEWYDDDVLVRSELISRLGFPVGSLPRTPITPGGLLPPSGARQDIAARTPTLERGCLEQAAGLCFRRNIKKTSFQRRLSPSAHARPGCDCRWSLHLPLVNVMHTLHSSFSRHPDSISQSHRHSFLPNYDRNGSPALNLALPTPPLPPAAFRRAAKGAPSRAG